MAEFHFWKLVYVLFLYSALIDIVITSQHYVEHTLSEEKICHPLGKKTHTFSLANEKNAAVVVKPTFRFDSWPPDCKFIFRAAKGVSLFAVIQNMYLRRNASGCVDYVKFKRKDKHETDRFCGQIDRRMGMDKYGRQRSIWEINSDGPNLQGYADYDPAGEIETMVVLSSMPLQPHEKLDLTIVYTPYRDCNKIKEHRDEYQRYDVANSNVSSCISKDYVCDEYRNCVDELCRDEDNCPIESNGTGTKVTIGAVTTMLLCFLIFVMGLWICRKHKKMCWSSDCAGPSGHDHRLARAERETAGSANPSVAVAPMLEVAVVPPVLDKDLPPSYDSLFPEQANPSTT